MVNIIAGIGINGKVKREDHHVIGYLGAVNPGRGPGPLHCHMKTLPAPAPAVVPLPFFFTEEPSWKLFKFIPMGKSPPTSWQTGSWPSPERPSCFNINSFTIEVCITSSR